MKQNNLENNFIGKEEKSLQIHHEGHRERIRERAEIGDVDSYQTHEIIEMMLYQE